MTKKTKVKNYGAGTFFITLLVIVCFASLLLPLVAGEYQISVMNAVRGKSVDGITLLPKMGIFGIACLVTMILPLLAMLIISLLPFDRIKKYVVSFFLSVVLLVGFLVVYYLVSSKFDGRAGIGFYLGILSAAALALTALYSLRRDPAGKKHKAVVWYNGVNKIVLLVCLPLAVAMIVFTVMMFDILNNLPLFTSIGVFLFIAGTIIAATVAIFTVFENYKSGLMYFLTGACWAVGIVLCMARAGFGALLAAIVVAIVCAVFWMSLGTISQKYF